MAEKMKQIERIRHMEELYDLATEAMKEQPMSASTHAKAQEPVKGLKIVRQCRTIHFHPGTVR